MQTKWKWVAVVLIAVAVAVFARFFRLTRPPKEGNVVMRSAALSASKTSICVGETVTWSGSSDPAGQQSYWYGTKNGVPDVSGVLAATTNFSLPATYTPDHIGTYTRYIKVGKGPSAVNSNTVTVAVNNCGVSATGKGNRSASPALGTR